MTPLLIAGGYSILLGLVLAFNRGAHRKPSPRPVPRTPTLLPDAGLVLVYVEDRTETTGERCVDGAELAWEGEG